ncbi:phosphoenolpyruvate carboxylase [Pacificimonas flava]|uniref:Phosphoenolpyruvate carboxylase n=2 Tax=Pacificimonas TaxID=1960290 RepID=A0A219B5K2_9SPHN|nr:MULTISPECIES: phosphoenolpyruvate carboxylase [Pacificimonas]MBZ6379136.1 phosphoenolpyruvate carboxylase [Pacificimonas aurantium]OWV33635.1 phosphoenolpyruvate carboxylase [Pacificimonas flava]
MSETSILSDLKGRLAELYDRTRETPLFNPVSQLAFELSRLIEGGKLRLQELSEIIEDYERHAFRDRAARLNDLLSPVNLGENDERLRALVRSDADFSQFRSRWERPFLGSVFTAHPTFMLSDGGYDALAKLASGEEADPELEGADPTLESEHAAVMATSKRAADARARMTSVLVDEARQAFPDKWRSFRPQPFSFATWVGYDMDGRTDIGWSMPIRFRLIEKSKQLERYSEALAELGEGESRLDAIRERLDRAQNHTRKVIAAFAGAGDDADALSDAANLMTTPHPDRLIAMDEMLGDLDAVIAEADEDLATRLVPVAAAMRTDRLGIGTVHFRMNASQLHNAIRRRMGGDTGLAMSSRTAIARLRSLIDEAEPVPVNFAALAIETTTALRQFIAMAQMLKHIDADSPIRLLIAECEQPATVLSALYFARLFGIEDRIDISPLFETNEALEHGGRFLDALFAEPAYQNYVRRRGVSAIQTGFSDAGRFMGQIPAALAIERLQGRMAELMGRHGLTDVAALIFNTHGESMGRGAHPLSVEARLAHALSRWARSRFAQQDIELRPEASFQGGDGYLFFGTEDLAYATLVRIAESSLALSADDAHDPFYEEVDVSLDFYRDVRRAQASLFRAPSYNRALTAFGLGLLPTTGSRRSRRQSESGERDMTLRQIRAIPNNAVLQQLGYPANVIAGVGSATEAERDQFASLFTQSKRAQDLIGLVEASDRLASIKTLVAYGEAFNGAYWATRPYRGAEPELENACLDLAERLTSDDRTAAFRELATMLRVDGLKLRQLIDLLPDEKLPGRNEERRRTLGVLHALRLALMQHIFLRAAAIPPFSRRNDISRDDILEMVFAMRIEDVLGLLRQAYPVDAANISDFDMEEPTGYPDNGGPAYEDIQERYIDAIETAYALTLKVTRAIAHSFGALG